MLPEALAGSRRAPEGNPAPTAGGDFHPALKTFCSGWDCRGTGAGILAQAGDRERTNPAAGAQRCVAAGLLRGLRAQ
jgi:hypothetical protein